MDFVFRHSILTGVTFYCVTGICGAWWSSGVRDHSALWRKTSSRREQAFPYKSFGGKSQFSVKTYFQKNYIQHGIVYVHKTKFLDKLWSHHSASNARYYGMYPIIDSKSQISHTPWTSAHYPKPGAKFHSLTYIRTRKIFVTYLFIIFPNCLILLYSWLVSKSNRQVKQTSEFKRIVLQENHSRYLQWRKIRFVYDLFVPDLVSFWLHLRSGDQFRKKKKQKKTQ